MLQAKKKTPRNARGRFHGENQSDAGAVAPAHHGCLSKCTAFITARTSDAINSYVKGRPSRVLRPWPRLSMRTARWPELISVGTW